MPPVSPSNYDASLDSRLLPSARRGAGALIEGGKRGYSPPNHRLDGTPPRFTIRLFRRNLLMDWGTQAGHKCFDELIPILRAEGLCDFTAKLHTLLHETAWTTSPELFGELGLAILDFEGTLCDVSSGLRGIFDPCTKLVRRFWPDIRCRGNDLFITRGPSSRARDSLDPFGRHVRAVLVQGQADCPARAVGLKADLCIHDLVEELPLAFGKNLDLCLTGRLGE